MRILSLFIVVLSCVALSGCASGKKGIKNSKPADQTEAMCESSCKIMGTCSAKQGIPYSEHDKVTCVIQCKSTQPILRAVVAQCSAEVLAKTCSSSAMHLCVQKKLMSLR